MSGRSIDPRGIPRKISSHLLKDGPPFALYYLAGR